MRSIAQRVRRRIARWAAPEPGGRAAPVAPPAEGNPAQLRDARTQLAAAAYQLPPEVEETVARVRRERLTYLKDENLRELAAMVIDADRGALPGLVIEAGTALGGSAIVMAAAKARERPMKVYDVFGTIPPPGSRDGPDVHRRFATIAAGEARGVGGDTYYGYRDDLYGEVRDSFSGSASPPPSTTSS